eukprot:5804443-Amphidinium_carterae.4
MSDDTDVVHTICSIVDFLFGRHHCPVQRHAGRLQFFACQHTFVSDLVIITLPTTRGPYGRMMQALSNMMHQVGKDVLIFGIAFRGPVTCWARWTNVYRAVVIVDQASQYFILLFKQQPRAIHYTSQGFQRGGMHRMGTDSVEYRRAQLSDLRFVFPTPTSTLPMNVCVLDGSVHRYNMGRLAAVDWFAAEADPSPAMSRCPSECRRAHMLYAPIPRNTCLVDGTAHYYNIARLDTVDWFAAEEDPSPKSTCTPTNSVCGDDDISHLLLEFRRVFHQFQCTLSHAQRSCRTPLAGLTARGGNTWALMEYLRMAEQEEEDLMQHYALTVEPEFLFHVPYLNYDGWVDGFVNATATMVQLLAAVLSRQLILGQHPRGINYYATDEIPSRRSMTIWSIPSDRRACTVMFDILVRARHALN